LDIGELHVTSSPFELQCVAVPPVPEFHGSETKVARIRPAAAALPASTALHPTDVIYAAISATLAKSPTRLLRRS
jgi:hypothetical protein